MKNKFMPVFCLLMGTLVLSATAQNSVRIFPQLGKSTIKEVVAALTLEEKVKLVVGNSSRNIQQVKSFNLSKLIVTEKVTNQVEPLEPIQNEYKSK